MQVFQVFTVARMASGRRNGQIGLNKGDEKARFGVNCHTGGRLTPSLSTGRVREYPSCFAWGRGISARSMKSGDFMRLSNVAGQFVWQIAVSASPEGRAKSGSTQSYASGVSV